MVEFEMNPMDPRAAMGRRWRIIMHPRKGAIVVFTRGDTDSGVKAWAHRVGTPTLQPRSRVRAGDRKRFKPADVLNAIESGLWVRAPTT